MITAASKALLAASAIPSIFSPSSTPADSIYHLSLFVMAVTGVIFVVVFSLLAYAAIKFRRHADDDGREPPQIYGSNQVELAWTVIPVLIVVVLFLAAARVIHAVEDAKFPPGTIEVTAIGHQFWWEFRYPEQGFISANELHVPVSDRGDPTPTHITLMSADTNHSFWVPQLAGKTDLIPNRVNNMWIDPHQTGVYVGQCAQYCGTQHVKMLLRVVVESREDFDKWLANEKQAAVQAASAAEGRHVFESTACKLSFSIGAGHCGIRERWTKPNTLGGDVAPPYRAKSAGDAVQGQSVYASYCSSCHGTGGSGGPKAGSVIDKSYLSLISDQGLRTLVITGRPDFNAPDWRNNVAGHPMSDQEITDVVAWLASQRPNGPSSSSSSAATSPGGAE